MGEASFDGRMIGLADQVITYPQWFFALILNTQRRLNRKAKEKTEQTGIYHAPVRVVQRDKPTGFWKVLPEIKVQLGPLLELPVYALRAELRASDPSFISGRPRHCGRRGLIDLLESGVDNTGRELIELKEELEASRQSKVKANQVVGDIKRQRMPSIRLRPGEYEEA